MMNARKILVSITIAVAGILAVLPGASAQQQDVLVVPPLFEYPLPPDTMTEPVNRANWLMRNFWSPMDFKSKKTVDQNALNDAFEVYITTMRFASEQEAAASTDRLIRSIEKNPVLCLQFAKAATESMYGPNANVWNDKLVLRFIDTVLRNKQISKDRKLRYERLNKILSATMTGAVPPAFDYQTPDGKSSHYEPNGVITVIEFGDPDCFDCRMAKLKMDTDVNFSSLVEKGKVNVLFIYVDPEEGWQQKLAGYPATWHVGASDEVSDLYDIRSTPSIYVIDREGRVAAKHIDAQTAMQIAGAAAQQ